jgi:hypothetical protein
MNTIATCSLRRIVFAAFLGLGPGTALAQDVGEIVYVQGVTSAQRPGGEARFLAKGDGIAQGEVINTSERGYAVLGLKDGSRLTLRSNTAFAVNELNQQPGSESLVMNLMRGGLRAITGLISKSRPTAANLTTATATIGIRGTEFDARLCAADCEREAQYARPAPAVTPPEAIVARVVQSSGEASAVAADGRARALPSGAPLFNGERVRTGVGSYLVLAFRDETKMTLVEKTELNLEDVRTAGPAEQGSFVVRLIAGGLRAITGLIGKANRNNVKFITPTATIGIRGTGVDLRLQPDGTFLYTWSGSAVLDSGGQQIVVDADHAGAVLTAGNLLQLLESVPPSFFSEPAPRPDTVPVNFDQLFAVQINGAVVPGLYVGVRDGNVSLVSASGFAVELGPFEAAVLGVGSDRPIRLDPLPGFLFNDPFPLPGVGDFRPLRLIELLGPGAPPANGQCLLI